MKLIKLFLASSIDEFEKERLEFERFIRVLDRILKTHGLELDLVACEDMPKDLSALSIQERINEQIPDCNYFFAIIGKEAGVKTVEEFEVALKSMKDSGKPKIYTYFYRLNLEALDSQSESVRQFIKRLNDDLNHYFSVFMNIDTVKLDFLMELCRDFPSGATLRFEDGEAVFQNEKVLSLANIPLYGNNTELTELIEQKQFLNEQFAATLAEYAAHPESAEVYQKMVKTSEERTRLLDRFHELERNVYSLYKEVKSGSADMTWYEREARKQVELGNYTAAAAILQDIQRKKELDQAVLFADTSLEKIKAHIRENELLIKTLKAQKRTAAIVNEIKRCYKESADLTLKYHLDNRVVYDYANFLVISMDDFEKTIELANIMKEQVKDDDIKTLADIYQLMGEAYLMSAHKLIEGRTYYSKAIELYYQLEDSHFKYYEIVFSTVRVIHTYYITNDYDAAYCLIINLQEIQEAKQRYLSDVSQALILRTLSSFYEHKGEHQSYSLAEEYATMALQKAKHNKENLRLCQDRLGSIYISQKKYEEAYKVYVSKYNLCKEMFSDNPYDARTLAYAAKDLGRLLYDMRKYNEAIGYTEEAVKHLRDLTTRNPLAFEFSLSACLHNLGLQFEAIDDYYNAEKSYREAYNRRKASLSREDVYEYEVIYSCRALAEVLTNLNRFDEAEILYREALTLSQQYAEKDPENESYVRSSKQQIVRYCLVPQHKYEEAQQFITELIDFQRRFLSERGLKTDGNIARYLDDYAFLLCRMGRAEEAVALIKESLSYYDTEAVRKEKPLAYTISLHNMAWVLRKAGRFEESAPYLGREIELREQMLQEGREGLEYLLASTYLGKGDYCSGVGRIDEGRIGYQKALASYEHLSEICPDAFASKLAETHLSYAKLLMKANDFASAGIHCRKAIDLYTALEKQATAVYHNDLIDAYDAYVAIQKSAGK